MKIIISLLVLISLNVGLSQNKVSYKDKEAQKLIMPLNLNEEKRFNLIVQYILQSYGESFKYHNELRNGYFEFSKDSYDNYYLNILSKNKIIDKIKLTRIKNSQGGYELVYRKNEIEKFVNQQLYNSIFPYRSNGSPLEIINREKILYDKLILKNENIAGMYWGILNKDFTLTHLKDQYKEQSELFRGLSSGVVIPYGTNGISSKILTIDNIFESIIYFDGDVMNSTGPINKVYGIGGRNSGEFANPNGITKGRDYELNDNIYYPLYIADQSNFRIDKVDLIITSNASSYIDNSSFKHFDNVNYPYDISYFKSLDDSANDKLWVSESHPFYPAISCFNRLGERIQKFIGYLDSSTNQVFIFSAGTKSRLAVYDQYYYAVSFIDNIRNTLVTCLLKDDGTAYSIPYGDNYLILANGNLTFPKEEPINSVHYQYTSNLNWSWPTVWVTSPNRIHDIRMNSHGHEQYLASTDKPYNSQQGYTEQSFGNLINTIVSHEYEDILTVENWSLDYGLRRYLPYVDLYSDSLYNYCLDTADHMKLKAWFTNDCWLKLTAERKEGANWIQVKFKSVTGSTLSNNNYTAIKYQLAGWNQSSIDLYVDVKLDLPIEYYSIGGKVRLNLTAYPEWQYPNDSTDFYITRSYQTEVRRTCLLQAGGCPYLYVKSSLDSQYKPDNNILHRSEFSDSGSDVIDFYKLQVNPLIQNDRIKLAFVENENDNSYIDYVRLWLVEYPEDRKMGVTEDNHIIVYDSASVYTADTILRINDNKDITSNLNYHNPGNPVTGITGDSIYAHFSYGDKLRFPKLSNSKISGNILSKNQQNREILNNPNEYEPFALITEVGNLLNPISHTKDTAAIITGNDINPIYFSSSFARREQSSVVIRPLSGNLIDNFTTFWQSDYRIKTIGITSIDYNLTPTELTLDTATKITMSSNYNILSLLTTKDNDYATFNDSSLLKLTFYVDNSVAHNGQLGYVLEVHGHYFNGGNDKVSKKNIIQLPTTFELYQNYPNPFNPTSTIKYALPKQSRVVIRIYDLLGREVITLVNEVKDAGYYQNIFDGTNYASGVYFYRIEAGSFVDSKKMVLVK